VGPPVGDSDPDGDVVELLVFDFGKIPKTHNNKNIKPITTAITTTQVHNTLWLIRDTFCLSSGCAGLGDAGCGIFINKYFKLYPSFSEYTF
jgi:hypothetical protein